MPPKTTGTMYFKFERLRGMRRQACCILLSSRWLLLVLNRLAAHVAQAARLKAPGPALHSSNLRRNAGG
eukprot:s2133_g12.t1